MSEPKPNAPLTQEREATLLHALSSARNWMSHYKWCDVCHDYMNDSPHPEDHPACTCGAEEAFSEVLPLLAQLGEDGYDPENTKRTLDWRKDQEQMRTDLRQLRAALAARDAEVARLREALYPLVVGGLEADAREDAPEYVNNEVYNGMCALPECPDCGGKGATDGKDYVDVAIPEDVRCARCEGWGFLKSALARIDALGG